MCDQSTVALALGLVSGMQHNLAGASLRSQNTADLPWTRWRDLKNAQARLADESTILCWWRDFLIIMSLLEPYMGGPQGLGHWSRAWCLSPRGRRVSCPATGIHVGWSLHRLLFHTTYQNCVLYASMAPPRSGTMVVHPACQCFSRPQRQPGTVNLRRGGGLMSDPSRIYLQRGARTRAVQAPWWVSKSAYSRQNMLANAWTGPSRCLPRWQVWSRTCGESVRGACRVPWRARESLERIDTAICHLQRFWNAFADAFQSCCFGDIGVSREMQEIQEAM